MSGIPIDIHHKVEILSGKDVEQIHHSALRVLEETGVVFKHEQALKILGDAGARVSDQIARLPAEMVEDLVSKAPRQITLCGRDREKDVHLGQGRVHYTNGYGAPHVRDLETGQIRPAILEDLARFTRLSDFLENVHYVLTQVTVQDYPPEVVDIFQVAELLRNTGKHVGLSISDATYVDEILQIGRLASGLPEGESCRNGCFSLGAVSLSPLMYSADGCHRLIRMAQEDVTIRISSLPISGATSPLTLAGTLVQAHAEVLAAICLVEAVNPGNAIIYGFVGAPMDMRSGKQYSASPESALLNCAMVQICDYCRLPFGYGTAGMVSSNDLDQQNGLERANSTLLAALVGMDAIHHAVGGPLASGLVACYEDLVVSNELCHMINRELRGIKVTDATLAVDVIRDVGPEGHYVEHQHTLEFLRQELFHSKMMDNRGPTERSEGEPPFLVTKARERAREILASHKVPGFDPETERRIQQLLDGVVAKSGATLNS